MLGDLWSPSPRPAVSSGGRGRRRCSTPPGGFAVARGASPGGRAPRNPHASGTSWQSAFCPLWARLWLRVLADLRSGCAWDWLAFDSARLLALANVGGGRSVD